MAQQISYEDVIKIQKGYQEDPVLFFEQVLGVEKKMIWWGMRKILYAISHHKKVAVKSGHGVSKSFTFGRIPLWWLSSYGPKAKTITTAPTFPQVEKILWSELHSAYNGCLRPLGGKLNKTDLTFNPDWFGIGVSTDEEQRFQGFHSENLLVLFDEAGGVKPAIYNGARGLVTGENSRWACIGNPIQSSGDFYDMFKPDSGWENITISCLDTPNYIIGREESIGVDECCKIVEGYKSYKELGLVSIPGLTGYETVEGWRKEWGESSPLWQSKCLGEFPIESSNTLIALKWVEDARLRDINLFELLGVHHEQRYFGVDVARYGVCFDNKTEILTDTGWKFFENLNGTEKVLSLDGEQSQWGDITKLHKYRFEGFLNEYNGEKVNFCITDEHKLLVKKNPKSNEYKLEEYNKLPKEFVIKRTNDWMGNNPEKIEFISKVKMPNGGYRNKIWSFDFKDWAEFLGWFISEGCVYKEKRKNGRLRILIAQKHEGKTKLIKELLERMGLIFKYKNIQFEFGNNEIGKHLIEFCGIGASNKRIPKYIKESKKEIIEIFLEAYCLGDGHKDKRGSTIFISSSELLIDDIQEMCVKLGRSGKKVICQKKGSSFYIGKRKVIRKHDIYTVRLNKRSADSEIKKKNVKKISYDGYVYCVSTPLKTIMVRRNGCCMWSGNCETVITCYDGYNMLYQKAFSKRNTVEVAGFIIDCLRNEKIYDAPIAIDDTGVGGGVTDILKEQGYNVIPVILRAVSDEPEKYYDLRTEIFCDLADKFQKGNIGMKDPDDNKRLYDKLAAELCSLTYEMTRKGTKKVTPKERIIAEMIKQHGQGGSPDRADSLSLAIYASKDRKKRGRKIKNPYTRIFAGKGAGGY